MKFGLLVLVLLATSSTFAQDAKKGEELYKQCIACHGIKGEGDVGQKAPRLSGQYAWYIEKQLTDMKGQKIRKNDVMMPFLSKLSPQDMKDLAAYISAL